MENVEKSRLIGIADLLARGLASELGFSKHSLHASEGEFMLIVVDSHQQAERFAVGVLVTTLGSATSWFKNHFKPWDRLRSLPGQRLSYKEARRSNECHAEDVAQFLGIANMCPGLLITILFPHSKIECLTSPQDAKSNPDLIQFRNWSDGQFERLQRTALSITIAMEFFHSPPNRWMLLHDTDELFETNRKSLSQDWICSFASAARNEATQIGLVTKDQVENRTLAKALLGIADFAAGGLSTTEITYQSKYPSNEADFVGAPGDLSPKDRVVSLWHSERGLPLSKASATFFGETGHISQFRSIPIPHKSK